MAHAFQNQDWQALNVLVALAPGLRSAVTEDRLILAWGLRECSHGGECPVVAGTGSGWSLHDADQEAQGLDGKQSWAVTMPISQLRPLSPTLSQNFPVYYR